VQPQVPPLHSWPAAHALLQPPQWFAFVSVLTQLVPQGISPAPQFVAHAPDEQTVPAGHTTPH
jgi:hypothetical protein